MPSLEIQCQNVFFFSGKNCNPQYSWINFALKIVSKSCSSESTNKILSFEKIAYELFLMVVAQNIDIKLDYLTFPVEVPSSGISLVDDYYSK